MDLISLDAVLFLLAVVVALRMPLPLPARKVALLAANFLFLWWFDPLAPLLFLSTSLLGFAAAKLAAGGAGTAVLWLAGAPLLVPLFLPKLKAFTGVSADVGNVVGVRLGLFLGASYFTLRAIHCVIEARRAGTLRFGLFDFLVYNSFFPTMVAGPIERADHFGKTYERLGRPDRADLRAGLSRLFVGALKKVVLGSILLQWAQPIATFDSQTLFAGNGSWAGGAPLLWWQAWLSLYAIALYAYVDFAGYSDMMIGAARLMGIRLAENFDNPYLRTSIADFWRGWHLSLSFWIRDYLFIPMCGRSASAIRPHLAALGSMTLCGLWHAPNLGWGLWGLAHGVGLSVHQAWTSWLRKRFALKKKLAASPAVRVVAVLLTFHFVALTWTLVSIDAERVSPTWAYLRVLFGAA